MQPTFSILLAILSGLAMGFFHGGMNLLFAQKLGIHASALLVTTTVFLLSSFIGSWLFRHTRHRQVWLYIAVVMCAGTISLTPFYWLDLAGRASPFWAQLISSLSLGLFPAISSICFLPVTLELLDQNRAEEQLHTLYSADLMATGLGWLLAYYFVIPHFGLQFLFRFLSGLFFTFAFFTWQLSRQQPQKLESPPQFRSSLPRSLYALAYATGFIFFANEMAWMNFWKLVIGSSIFTQPIILIVLFFSMGLGILLCCHKKWNAAWLTSLLKLQLVAAVALVTILALIPKLTLLLVEAYKISPDPFPKPALQLAISLVFLAVPFACSGIPFATVMKRHPHSQSLLHLLGANVIGSLIGLWVAAKFEIAFFGSVNSLLVNTGVFSVVVFLFAPRALIHRLILSTTLAALAVGGILHQRWDWTQIWNGGANYFHFALPKWQSFVTQKESFDSGFVTVARDGSQNYLLLNGIFQGNEHAEATDQFGFSLVPHFFVSQTDLAVNIGLGAGGSASVLAQLPYTRLDVVEVARDIIEISRVHMASVNAPLFASSRIRWVIDDGRRFLDNRNQDLYSLITIEVNNMWVGGAQNLYSREFYRQAKSRLAQGGIFQQWLQLHHTSPETIAITLRTLKSVFKHVEVWIPHRQGVIFASDEPLTIKPDRIIEAKRMTTLAPDVLDAVLTGSFMHDEDVDCFLASSLAGLAAINTDDNQLLAYRGYTEVALRWNLKENIDALQAGTSQGCVDRDLSQPQRWRALHPQIRGW